jgi:hypothetical protein
MKRLSILVITAALVIGVAGAYAATGGPYTKGDAEAMLNNYPPGKGTIDRLVPEPVTRSLDIRPFSGFYDALTYCPQDWHVIALLWDVPEFVAPTAGVVWTAVSARAYLAGLTTTFVLDGAPFAVEKKPIKPYLTPFDPDFWLGYLRELYGPDVVVGQLWATQWGQILSPSALAPGVHTLSVVVSEPAPGGPIFADGITFTVSQADSPACST